MATSAKLSATTTYTLQISKLATASESGSNWGTVHKMSGAHEVTSAENADSTSPYYNMGEGTIVPVEVDLQPVSTVAGTGVMTLNFVKDTAWAADNTDNKSYASTFDTAETTRYLTDNFQITAAQACRLYLTDDTAFTSSDPNSELGKTLRMALLIKSTSAADSTARTYIYQIDSANGTTRYDTSLNNATAVDGIQKAINTVGAAASITASNLNEGSVKAIALASAPTDANSLIAPANIGDADCLYTFSANEVIDVTVYIWMEGCDYECNATESATKYLGDLTASLAFSAAAPA